jgi:hypothetical protein
MIVLKPRSDCPDVTRLQRGLWPNEASRVPRGTLSDVLLLNRDRASSSGGRIHPHNITSR